MPLPPPPAEALMMTGIADILARSGRRRRVFSISPRKPGTVDTFRCSCSLLRLDLVAHRRDRSRIRADEHDAGRIKSATGKASRSDKKP